MIFSRTAHNVASLPSKTALLVRSAMRKRFRDALRHALGRQLAVRRVNPAMPHI